MTMIRASLCGLIVADALDVITEIADDLYYDCNIDEYTRSTDPRDIAWEEKYVHITYPRKKND